MECQFGEILRSGRDWKVEGGAIDDMKERENENLRDVQNFGGNKELRGALAAKLSEQSPKRLLKAERHVLYCGMVSFRGHPRDERSAGAILGESHASCIDIEKSEDTQYHTIVRIWSLTSTLSEASSAWKLHRSPCAWRYRHQRRGSCRPPWRWENDGPTDGDGI